MSRRDYEAIAGAVAKACRTEDEEGIHAIERTVELIADALEANPNFDRERFITATKEVTGS